VRGVLLPFAKHTPLGGKKHTPLGGKKGEKGKGEKAFPFVKKHCFFTKDKQRPLALSKSFGELQEPVILTHPVMLKRQLNWERLLTSEKKLNNRKTFFYKFRGQTSNFSKTQNLFYSFSSLHKESYNKENAKTKLSNSYFLTPFKKLLISHFLSPFPLAFRRRGKKKPLGEGGKSNPLPLPVPPLGGALEKKRSFFSQRARGRGIGTGTMGSLAFKKKRSFFLQGVKGVALIFISKLQKKQIEQTLVLNFFSGSQKLTHFNETNSFFNCIMLKEITLRKTKNKVLHAILLFNQFFIIYNSLKIKKVFALSLFPFSPFPVPLYLFPLFPPHLKVRGVLLPCPPLGGKKGEKGKGEKKGSSKRYRGKREEAHPFTFLPSPFTLQSKGLLFSPCFAKQGEKRDGDRGRDRYSNNNFKNIIFKSILFFMIQWKLVHKFKRRQNESILLALPIKNLITHIDTFLILIPFTDFLNSEYFCTKQSKRVNPNRFYRTPTLVGVRGDELYVELYNKFFQKKGIKRVKTKMEFLKNQWSYSNFLISSLPFYFRSLTNLNLSQNKLFQETQMLFGFLLYQGNIEIKTHLFYLDNLYVSKSLKSRKSSKSLSLQDSFNTEFFLITKSFKQLRNLIFKILSLQSTQQNCLLNSKNEQTNLGVSYFYIIGFYLLNLLFHNIIFKKEDNLTWVSLNHYYIMKNLIKKNINIPFSIVLIYLNLHFRFLISFCDNIKKRISIKLISTLIKNYSPFSNLSLDSFNYKTKNLNNLLFNSTFRSQNTLPTKLILWQWNKKNQNKKSLYSIFKKYWLKITTINFAIKIETKNKIRFYYSHCFLYKNERLLSINKNKKNFNHKEQQLFNYKKKKLPIFGLKLVFSFYLSSSTSSQFPPSPLGEGGCFAFPLKGVALQGEKGGALEKKRSFFSQRARGIGTGKNKKQYVKDKGDGYRGKDVNRKHYYQIQNIIGNFTIYQSLKTIINALFFFKNVVKNKVKIEKEYRMLITNLSILNDVKYSFLVWSWSLPLTFIREKGGCFAKGKITKKNDLLKLRLRHKKKKIILIKSLSKLDFAFLKELRSFSQMNSQKKINYSINKPLKLSVKKLQKNKKTSYPWRQKLLIFFQSKQKLKYFDFLKELKGQDILSFKIFKNKQKIKRIIKQVFKKTYKSSSVELKTKTIYLYTYYLIYK
jgi:hypothetical protein